MGAAFAKSFRIILMIMLIVQVIICSVSLFFFVLNPTKRQAVKQLKNYPEHLFNDLNDAQNPLAALVNISVLAIALIMLALIISSRDFVCQLAVIKFCIRGKKVKLS